MTIPLSFETKLRRVHKNLEAAHREFKNSQDMDALASDILDVLVTCHLLHDRMMNHLWEVAKAACASPRKPNLYFPIVASEEDLEKRLVQYQLGDLAASRPKVREFLSECQPYHDDKNAWLKMMYSISRERHERDPKVTQVGEVGIGFGYGQDIEGGSLRISGGVMEFDGIVARRQGTRQVEPLRIDVVKQDRAILESIGIEVGPFAATCVNGTSENVAKFFLAMR